MTDDAAPVSGSWPVYAAAAISWLGFLVHNVADLPGQTLLSPETLVPSLVTAALVVAYAAGWRRVAAVGLLGYGAFIELVQSLLPSRTADATELLADALGVAAGLFLVAMLRRMW